MRQPTPAGGDSHLLPPDHYDVHPDDRVRREVLMRDGQLADVWTEAWEPDEDLRERGFRPCEGCGAWCEPDPSEHEPTCVHCAAVVGEIEDVGTWPDDAA